MNGQLGLQATRAPNGQPVLLFALSPMPMDAVKVLRLLREQFPDEYKAVGMELIAANGRAIRPPETDPG